MLGAALVAAVLLPRLLRAFCEFELGLGAAFVIALGRAIASLAAAMFLTTTFPSPAMPTSATFVLLPTLLSLVVADQLLKHLAQSVQRLARGDLAQAWLEPEPAVPNAATGEWSRLLRPSGSRSPSCSQAWSGPSGTAFRARSPRRFRISRLLPTVSRTRRHRARPAAPPSLTSSLESEASRAPWSTSRRRHGAATTAAASSSTCAVSTRSTARWRSSSQLARKPSSDPSAPSPDTASSSAASRHRLS